MSDPLSKIYCVYCEHMWRDSLFDATRFNHTNGLVRMCDLTKTGREHVTSVAGSPPTGDDSVPFAAFFIRRYADDCRAVCFYDATSVFARKMAGSIIESYKRDCYIKPCSLDDEHRGSHFPFLQGSFSFSGSGCRSDYDHRNGPSLLAGKPREFRSMQHFLSYGQSHSQLRFATLCGKLVEIDTFCSEPLLIAKSVFSLCVELCELQYPYSVVRRALWKKARATGSEVWSLLARVSRPIYSILSDSSPL